MVFVTIVTLKKLVPFTNQDLKRIERKLKNKEVFGSEGTFGTRSLFYWDKKVNKFLGFQYLVKDYENNPQMDFQ